MADAPTSTAPIPPAPSPPSAAAPPEGSAAPKRRERSCLAVYIGSALDGGVFGAIIGALFATAPAVSHGLLNGGLRFIGASAMRSGFSLGGFMATYNGGVCSLEKARGTKDVLNPFVVGFGSGVVGALPGYVHPMPQAPWAYRNPRALLGGGLGSGLLCAFFWGLSRVGRETAAPAEEEKAAAPQPPSAPLVRPPAAVPQMPKPVETEFLDAAGAPPAAAPDFATFAPPPDQQGGDAEALRDPWASK